MKPSGIFSEPSDLGQGMGMEKAAQQAQDTLPERDGTDLLSEAELSEGEGPQVDALLPDLGLELLPELVFHNYAQVGPDLGDDL